MPAEPRPVASLEIVAGEHHRLENLLARLRETLRTQQSNTAEIAGSLGELESLLVAHFENEEDGGYFDHIIAAKPNLKSRVDALIEQHVRMLGAVRHMQSRVRRCLATTFPSHGISGDFERLLRDFVAHESEENNLVQDAHLQDIGEEG
jgi:hemerythrin HHE cation binding domain-containing protein